MRHSSSAPRGGGPRRAAGSHRAERPVGTGASRTNRTAMAKLLGSVALVAAAASVAGLATYGSFTAGTSAGQSVANSTVTLTAAAPQGLALTVPAMVPGQTVDRVITLQRGATDEPFGAVNLTAAATGDPALTNGANGLQLLVDICPVPWTTTTTPASCQVTQKPAPVVATRPVLSGPTTSLPAVTTALNATARTAHLKLSLTLPEATSNDTQGKSGTFAFDFVATQRSGQVR